MTWKVASKAAAYYGFAVAGDVESKADAGHELRVLVVHAILRHAGVAGEHHAGRQRAELGRTLVRRVVGGIECSLRSDPVRPGGEVFPADAVVQGEAGSHLPAVLGVNPWEVVAVVDQLIVPLAESSHKALLEVRRRIDVAAERTETEAAVRGVDVDHVEPAQIGSASEGKIVGSFHPVQVVVEGVVVAVPGRKRRGRRPEITGDGRLQIGAGRRLPDVLHSKCGDVRTDRKSTRL